MNDCVFISFEHAGMRGVFAACGSLPDFLKDLSKWPVMDEISEGSAAFFGVADCGVGPDFSLWDTAEAEELFLAGFEGVSGDPEHPTRQKSSDKTTTQI